MCNLDLIQQVAAPLDDEYTFEETVRGLLVSRVVEKWILDVKDGTDKHTLMGTWRPPTAILQEKQYLENKCDIVFVNPVYIRSQQKMGWPTLTREKVEKAVNPQMSKRISQSFNRLGQEFVNGPLGRSKQPKAYVNLIETAALTVLHEVSRMISPLHSPLEYETLYKHSAADSSALANPYTPGPPI